MPSPASCGLWKAAAVGSIDPTTPAAPAGRYALAAAASCGVVLHLGEGSPLEVGLRLLLRPARPPPAIGLCIPPDAAFISPSAVAAATASVFPTPYAPTAPYCDGSPA